MKNILRTAILLFTLVSFTQLYAQFPGCPSVTTASNVTIPCGQTCANLTATAFSAAQTTAYTVGSIPYSPPFPYNTGTQVLVATDDLWSGVINLPFHFCFFGNNYNSLVVGSNGVVSFNTTNAGAFNSWSIPGAIPSATPADLTNCIMSPWQDLDPTNAGRIYYEIGGTAPCRYFKVAWYQCPMYGDPNSVSTSSCGGQTYQQTQMIVLYETTNAIDVYIQQKGTCTGWNSGNAIEGIQNAAGTVAYTVPGRNATNWNASNDAWRFLPNGAPNYTIAWFQGGTQIGTGSTIQVCPSASTTYTAQATYTDCDGSTINVSSNVFVGLASLNISVDSVHQVSCYNGSDGAVYASYSTTSAVLSYGWSPGGAGQTSLTGIPAGTYIFTVTTADGCSKSDTVTLTNPPQLLASVADTSLNGCNAAVNASLTVNASGGTPGYGYSWSNSGTTATISGLSAGAYTVTVNDSKNCSVTTSGNVNIIGNPIAFDQPQLSNPTCSGGSNGSIVVSVSGATPPVSYIWSTGTSTTNTLSNLTAGTYNVTATDSTGCSATASYTLTEPSPVVFTSSIVTDANCNGSSSGSVSVSVSGGTGTISYTWSNGGSGATISGLLAGTYNVTASDSLGCSATASYTVNEPTSVTFGSSTITNTTCSGANTGSISTTATGGTGSISFSWSNGGTGATITGLAAGTYTVTAADSLGCSATASYSVTQPSGVTFNTPSITGAGCNGGGSITANATGGTGTINYSWSNGGLTATISNLTAGTYNVTATDSLGCSATASYVVNQLPGIIIDSAHVTEVACQGTGAIQITAHGGTGTLTYTWSNGGTGNPLTGIATGGYTVTITDQNGCSVTGYYIVGHSLCGGCPEVNTNNNVAIPCSQNCTTLSASAFSGAQTTAYSVGQIAYNPPFAYNTGTPILVAIDDRWSGVINLPFNFCFFGNVYNKIVVGSNGVVSFNVANANAFNSWNIPGPIPAATPTDLTNCIMGPWQDMDPTNQGHIYYQITGTYPCRKFEVSWDLVPMYGDPNSVSTSACGGTQFHQTQMIVLYETTNAIDVYIQQKGTCTGWNSGRAIEGIQNAAGTIAYTVPGRNATQWTASNDAWRFTPAGAPNYTIAWFLNGNQIGSADTITVCPVIPTTYTVQATYTNCDNSTITVSDSVYVTPGGNLVATVDSVHNPSCFGNDGAVYASYSAGGTVSSFGWSPGGANQTSMTNLPAGTYIFTVSTTDGCIKSDTVTLTAPQQLVVTVPDTSISSCSSNITSGSLTAHVAGGASPYSYLWSNGATTQTISGVTQGTYSVTVTDANGCTASASGTISISGQPITFNPAQITNINCGTGFGSIIVSLNGATPPITYTWSNNLPNSDTVSGLTAGTYNVTATDANGCSATASYTITNSPAIVIDSAIITNAGCSGNNTGAISLVVSGGSGNLSFNWSNGGTSATIAGLAGGTYTVTITDAANCSTTGSYTVGQSSPLTFGNPTITNVGCTGGNTGSITSTVNGGTGTIVYTWSNGGNGATISNLSAGTYNVTVTDSLGCSATAAYTVNQSSPLAIDSANVTPVACQGTGAIQLTVSGGTTPLTYTWSNGGSGNPLTGIPAGSYTVTITDANGCSVTGYYIVGHSNCGGCPEVNTNNNVVIPCSQNCATLSASAFSGAQTTSYNVNQIAYNPPFAYNTGTPILVATDDLWSGVINLPFNFCFFGNVYSKILVGSNGVVSFNVANANAFNSWNIPGPIPSANPTDLTNCIMSPWQDMDPTNQGTIYYQITGTYPCRKFEVSWYQVPMYGDANSVNTSSCGGQTYQQTQMIVLYETTNAIDVYIQQKGTCTGWNSGRAIEGIQNAAGTIAYTVPGRNATQWTASNDAWRFTPAGAPNYTIAWFLNGNQIGSADTITVCPVIPTTYTVQATYTNCDNSTITVSDSVYVTPGGSLTVNIDSVKNPTCNGSNTGAVYASYNTNNTTVTSFGWSPGGANQTSMTNLPAGTYVFTVTTANGCEKSDTVTLVDPPLLIVSVADTTVHTCSSGSVNGTLTANVSGGTPAYSYLWSNGGATATITGLAPGTYTVTVTDANGCSNTASGTVTVVVSNLSFGNTQITNVTCNAGNNGSIVVAVDSATPPVVYTWSNNLPNSDTVTGLSAGTYNLTVTDANGCSLTASYTITQPSPIVIDSTHMTQAGCTVGGTLQVFASGGTGTLTFNWSNGQSGDSLTGLAGGPYTVTITDANGCSITATDSVIAAPGAISFGTPVIVNVTCSGDSNGSITIVTSGGTGTIHYTWSTGDSTATISGLAAGTYSVTATDSVGCSASTSYIVNQPTPITFGTSTIVDASCVGSTGSITVTASGGTGTINFTWSNGGTTDTITGLGAGIYTVTATDVNGCTATASYTVNQPPAIVVDTTHISQATCSAGGCIQVVASGGIGTLSYSWSNGLTGDSICGVEAGTYTLTITDQSSCSITASYTVTAAPGTIVFGTPVIVDVACNSGNTGSITATTTGGTGTVYYHWSNGDSTLSISGLTAGTYTITASDSVGCSATASYTVNQPTAITLDSSSVTQATCLSGGCIHIAVSGGTGTLTYNWSNGQQSSDSVCGLAGGSYTLTVTDANSCTVTFTFNVGAAPNAITFGTPTIVDVTCGGAQNGSITISTSGGLGTIHYVWSNGDTTTTINGLAGGTYSVTASDAGGCSASTSYVVNEPSPISIDGTVITQATCTTGGCIIVSGFGGTGTLTYTWSNEMSGDSICGLAGANYTLTITDASGCSITAVDSVPAAPGAISFGNATIVSPTCHGGNNGSITITTTGGTGTVHYVWSTLTDTTATISGLTAGTYSVTAFDLTGCSASISYVVTEPSAITVDSSNITPAGCTLGGCVTVYASGGTGTLTFGWSNQQSGATVCNLAAGAYTVTVTDSTSCTATASFTVPTSPSSLAIDSATVINVACNGGNSGSITLHTSGGTGTVHYTWSTQDTTATISGLIAGTYTVTVLDNGGCSASGSYTVNQPSALSASIDYTHVICFDATNGTACAVVSGGTPAYTYHWNNNSDSICQIGLPVGIVLVTVTDANGCTAASSAIIGQSPSLAYNSQVNQPTCADLGFGTELLTPRGGTGSVTINIDALSIDTTLSMAGGDTTAVFNNVPTGNYTFTLTDSLGCTATGNFFVNAGAAGESFGAVADSTSCYGEQFNDGSITITPLTPANAPYTYSLNGGPFGTDSVFANLPAGTYTIYTQNTYGCIDSVRATVYSPAQVFVNATPDTIFTAPGVANTITVYDSNYVNPVYTWSPTSGLSCTDCYNPSATVSVQTVYYVTVSEEANSHCAAWDSVVIIVNGKFVMPDAFTPNKDGKNDLFGPVSFGLTNVKEFKIYDRWGALVHNATDDWDGTFNGKDQPAGTYVYYIVVETPDPNNAGAMKREGKQGSFTLLR